MKSTKNDNVNHPSHYTDGKYECIDFIESWGLGFHLGNAVKYITRAGKKDPEKTKEDIEKAIWYVKRARDYNKPLIYYVSPVIACDVSDTFNISDEKNDKKIDVYDYATDKRLSHTLSFALLNIVRGDLNAALIYLNAELRCHL